MTLTRMREIVAEARRDTSTHGDVEMRDTLVLLATIAGIDAPDVDLNGFTERALAATPGPWALRTDESELLVCVEQVGSHPRAHVAATHQTEDAAHIVGAHPAAMLTLLARLRREIAIGKAERALREARDLADAAAALVSRTGHSHPDDARIFADHQAARDALRALGVEP